MSGVAFLFPGQGSQHTGMGRTLAQRFPEARQVFEEADDALAFPLSRLCFEGSERELSLTENTQPAILTVSIAALRVLESHGLRPDAAAGHSLGEYGACVAAGVLAFRDAVGLVRRRGRFMQEAVPVGEGAMAAILGLALPAVEEVCLDAQEGRIVSVANRNGPQQIVIAGHACAVARAMERALERGARRALLLPVSAPFHCALMTPARERLEPLLRATPFRHASFPVYTNVDAAPVEEADSLRAALVRQVVAPVRWQETIETMAAKGIGTCVEIGPGKVLTGLTRRIRSGMQSLHAGDPETVEAAARQLVGVT